MLVFAHAIFLANCIMLINGQGQGYVGRQPNCAAVLCAAVNCPRPIRPITRPGECCPICPGRPSICERVRCATPPLECDTYIPEGQCCPLCRPGKQCHLVDCQPLNCRRRRQYTPPGQCCPVCRRPRRRPNCNSRTCPRVFCEDSYIPRGECCRVCRGNPRGGRY
ncbi:uncharacterized protein DDB_G0274171-like [Mercenaria mercenaria]|uniref:uncharacterized protein DDB_G0274171-like n=1 Tax=Mercenaria mercenaria TaxID=6596 RepID=UPI00234F51D4|nr:uncharacterized protein DDB_G0274171-like [Mercenaria mercenaria]